MDMFQLIFKIALRLSMLRPFKGAATRAQMRWCVPEKAEN